MSLLTRVFLGIATGLVSVNVWAVYDINCQNESCLTDGWSIEDRQLGNVNQVECSLGDCLNEGWVETARFRNATEVVCKPEGCFAEGWVEYDYYSGNFLGEVICSLPGVEEDNDKEGLNCLTYGWMVYQPGRFAGRVTCNDNDCRGQGWEVNWPGGGHQWSRCKKDNCFQWGWVLSP